MAKTQFPTPSKKEFELHSYCVMFVAQNGSVRKEYFYGRHEALDEYKCLIRFDFECCLWRWNDTNDSAEFLSYFPGK